MLSLVYVSSSTTLLTDEDLVEILKRSQEKNKRLDITGMLLYRDGNIIQVLEGPEQAVRDLFSVIQQDPRHRGVIVLLEREIAAREFPDWTMAFRNLNDPDIHNVPGYSEYMNQPLDRESLMTDPNRAQRLLELFRHHLER